MAKIEKICEQCGKVFYVWPYREHNAKYCSKKCYTKSHSNQTQKKCLQCGKIFSIRKSHTSRGRGKFCSKNCYSDYMSAHNVGENHPRYKNITATCAYCGKEFHIEKNQIRTTDGNFCGQYCRSKWISENKRGKNAYRWEGGLSFEPYCILFNKEFKNRVRSYFGNKCVICGKTKEENHNKAMCIHHVNYDKETCCNDSERLFVPLCNSCHSKTNANRDYWQDYFTKMINEKHGGKCYYTKEEYNGIKIA